MTTIQLRRGTSQEWVAANPILAPGEVGVELDTNKFKIGDGVTYWSVAEYYVPAPDVMAAIQAEMDEHTAAANPHPQYGSASGLPDHIAAADPHPQYASDADLAAHVAHANPHPVYATDVDLTTHISAPDPHPQYATDADLTAHVAAANPHPIYATDSDLLNHRSDPEAHPQYATDVELLEHESNAELTYEKKDTLLQEAAWWIDAAHAKTDRLVDLSGNGRDMIFEEGAAAPIVLPWDGDDYIHMPELSGAENITTPFSLSPAYTTDVDITFDLDMGPVGTGTTGYLQLWIPNGGPNSHHQILVSRLTNVMVFYSWNGTGVVADFAGPVIPTGRHLVRVRFTVTGWEAWIDGVFVKSGALAHVAPATAATAYKTGGLTGGPNNTTTRLYSLQAKVDGVLVVELLPKNAHTDYSKIKNTGSLGGDWTITRSATGFKTTVVDRPLLLFGGLQDAKVPTAFPVAKKVTFAVVWRHFGSPTTNNVIIDSRVSWNDGWCAYVNLSDGNRTAVLRGPAGAGYQPAVAKKDGQSSMVMSSDGVLDTYIYDDGSRLVGTTGWTTGIHMGPISLGGKSGGRYNGEFVAAAYFDRALTATELVQLSKDLLGAAHVDQPDPHPQYLLTSEGNTFYEAKSDLLKESVWWVDAQVSEDNRLIDLSGKGRDAFFAGDNLPVKLPWDGDDYLWTSKAAVGSYGFLSTPSALAEATNVVITLDMDLYSYISGAAGGLFDTVFATTDKNLSIGPTSSNSGILASIVRNGAGITNIGIGTMPLGRMQHRFTFNAGVLTYHTSLDGVTWTLKGTADHSATSTTIKLTAFYMGYAYGIGVGLNAKLYRLNVVAAGVTVFNADPHNVSADYLTIKNTGSVGGNFTIGRAGVGFKTTLVNRPLLLFGGLQYIESVMDDVGPTQYTALVAARFFGNGENDRMLCIGSTSTVDGRGVYIVRNNVAKTGTAYAYGSTQRDGSSNQVMPSGEVVMGLSATPTRVYILPSKTEDVATARLDFPPAWRPGDRISIGRSWSGTVFSGIISAEIIAAAIWDRALTDAEIAQVSQELAGIPHVKQINPHPQYAWKKVTLWADLPLVGDFAGQRIQVTAGLGLCIAMWNGTAWVVAPESDTGWLDVPVINGWTKTSLKTRRQGDRVVLHANSINGTAATADAFANAAVGFRQIYSMNGYQPAANYDRTTLYIGVFNTNTYQSNLRSGLYFEISYACLPVWPTTAPV